jgi:hypothetical protein
MAKKAASKKSVKTEAQILHTSKCRTISDKSELTYNIAIDDKGSVQVRINNNTGGGYWSKEWVNFDKIVSTLADVPEDKPITSIHLFKLFEGKSSNSPGFLLAFLLNEGLLQPFQGKNRQYAPTKNGAEKFLAKVNKLKNS